MGKLDVLCDSLVLVPLRLDWIGCSQNGRSRIQRANDPSFGNGQSLLFLYENIHVQYIEHGHQYGVNRSIDEIRDECYCTLLTMTSCKTDLVLSFILSNSSMQQIPLSLNTKAPLKNGLYSYLQLSSLYTFFSPYHN